MLFPYGGNSPDPKNHTANKIRENESVIDIRSPAEICFVLISFLPFQILSCLIAFPSSAVYDRSRCCRCCKSHDRRPDNHIEVIACLRSFIAAVYSTCVIRRLLLYRFISSSICYRYACSGTYTPARLPIQPYLNHYLSLHPREHQRVLHPQPQFLRSARHLSVPLPKLHSPCSDRSDMSFHRFTVLTSSGSYHSLLIHCPVLRRIFPAVDFRRILCLDLITELYCRLSFSTVKRSAAYNKTRLYSYPFELRLSDHWNYMLQIHLQLLNSPRVQDAPDIGYFYFSCVSRMVAVDQQRRSVCIYPVAVISDRIHIFTCPVYRSILYIEFP